MNFTRRHAREDTPEINLIPLIDVLLVMLIFLAATTSFLRQSALAVALPEADAQSAQPAMLELTISRDGQYALDDRPLEITSIATLAQALRLGIGATDQATLLIRADAQTSHQNVVNAMQAAQRAGIARVNFATQSAP